MTSAAGALPDSVAAVDLGSNSFHMIVARTASGELAVVDRLREMVRLASGLGDDRNLTEKAQQRALSCLERFGERLRQMPSGSVRAVGTNTLRRARNAADFIAAAEQALGHPIETISGIEEARLVYLGAARSMPDRGARRLVVDIGGGSTEVIIGEQRSPLALDSLYLGCVSMSEAHFAGGDVDEKRWKRAELGALSEFEPLQARYRRLGWEEAIGTSGTIRAIDRVVRAAGWSNRGITPKALRRLREAMLEAGNIERLMLEGLSSERRPVFAGGVVVLTAAFEVLGVEQMVAATGALREGLLYDLVGRIRHEDIRDASVAALAERYHVDWEQAGRVERTALDLLAQIEGDGKRSIEPLGQLLAWATRVHEIGLDIAHAQYHKHGEYILAHSDLMGFSREEQRSLAALVRAHRRKFPGAVVKALAGRRSRQIERLALVLRLAVILHRSRGSDVPPVPRIKLGKKSLKVTFAEGWLDQQPLTLADLQQECAYLKSVGYELELS